MKERNMDCFAYVSNNTCNALTNINCENCSFYRTKEENARQIVKHSCAKKVVDGIVFRIRPN